MSKVNCRTYSGELDIYTLEEASEKTRCSALSILKMAADGRISLCTTIPTGWEIFNIEIVALPHCQQKKLMPLFLSLRDSYFGTFEKADPAIELLFLSTEDCKNIANLNHTKQGAFIFGLRTTYNSPPSRAKPTEKKSTYQIGHRNIYRSAFLTRCFAICKKPTSKEEIIHWQVGQFPYQETTITKETIRIEHKELEKILENASICEQNELNEPRAISNKTNSITAINPELKNISQRLYTPGRSRTKLLETLYIVAKYSWEIYQSTGKYPSNSEVETNIKKTCTGCSKSLAQKAATIIRPTFTKTNEPNNLFLTNYFWALIDMSEKFYRRSLPEEEIDRVEILQQLENDLKFESSLALYGSRIIDPYFETNRKTDT